MTRRLNLSAQILAALLATASPTVAQSPVDTAVGQLEAQGFEIRSVRRTLLGRTRIVAESPEGRREIVLNPRNGLVLRDFFDRDEEEDNDDLEDKGEDLDEDQDEGDDEDGPDGDSGDEGDGGGVSDEDDDREDRGEDDDDDEE